MAEAGSADDVDVAAVLAVGKSLFQKGDYPAAADALSALLKHLYVAMLF